MKDYIPHNSTMFPLLHHMRSGSAPQGISEYMLPLLGNENIKLTVQLQSTAQKPFFTLTGPAMCFHTTI